MKSLNFRLVVFAEGGPDYQFARMRLENQGLESGFFNSICTYNAESLKTKFPGFFRAHEVFIQSNLHGYGKWIWKPFLIWKNLLELEDGDFIIYLDAGCEINSHSDFAQTKWKQYIERADKQEILAFQLNDFQFNEHPVLIEKAWSRIDLTHEISIGENEMSTNQIEANFLIIKNCARTRKTILEWYEFCFKNNYKYLLEPATDQRFLEYKDYRYDQSILSLLLKKYSFKPMANENYFHPNWMQDGKNFPVWTARNRTGESIKGHLLSDTTPDSGSLEMRGEF
jgi:hypothetical protein